MTLGWYLEIQIVHHGVGVQKKQRDVDENKTFSTLKGCRVEMLNSGLLGWMPKSNLVKMCFFGLFPGFFLWSQTSWMKMAVRILPGVFENFGSGKWSKLVTSDWWGGGIQTCFDFQPFIYRAYFIWGRYFWKLGRNHHLDLKETKEIQTEVEVNIFSLDVSILNDCFLELMWLIHTSAFFSSLLATVDGLDKPSK